MELFYIHKNLNRRECFAPEIGFPVLLLLCFIQSYFGNLIFKKRILLLCQKQRKRNITRSRERWGVYPGLVRLVARFLS